MDYRVAKRLDRKEDGAVRRFWTLVLIETGNKRNYILISVACIPHTLGIGGRIAHSDLKIGFRANLNAETRLNAKKIWKAKSFDLRGPNLVGPAIAFKLDRFESEHAELVH
jgi:hypothetical protein